jgi:hypothetical protein
LTPNAEEYSPTEVAGTDSELRTPNREVFRATGEAGTSEGRPDRYLDDISADEESANAPADETTKAKNARLRTMCGSRAGGWSLPGVMSD